MQVEYAMNFFKTVSFFYQNKFVNPITATLRHTGWQFRKALNLFPYDLRVQNFVVRVADRSIANGCGALLNAMGYYDPNNMYFLEEIFHRRLYKNFFDIGANIGIYSLLAASQSKNMRVFSFEPHYYTFSLLQENVRLNSLAERITCFQIALSDHCGSEPFLDKPGNPINRILDSTETDERTVTVDVGRGDSIISEKAISPEVLKIDVEGHENKVISGFESSIDKIQMIFVECQRIEVTTRLLCDHFHFLGPFKIDYRGRQLVRKNIHYEDWIFINPLSVESLGKLVRIQV